MTWSLNRLRIFEQCHAKYQYRYIDRLADNPALRGGAADRGTSIHKQIEDSIKGTLPLPREAAHIIGTIESLKGAGHVHEPEYNIRLDREWKLVIVGDYWHHAIIDLYVRESPTVAVLHDWKTGKIYPDHDEQKELYALDLFCAYPELEEVQTYFDYLDLGRTVPRIFHPHMVEPTKERWEQRVKAMEECTDFYPSPSYGCRKCSYSRSNGGPCRF